MLARESFVGRRGVVMGKADGVRLLLGNRRDGAFRHHPTFFSFPEIPIELWKSLKTGMGENRRSLPPGFPFLSGMRS